MSVRRAQAEIDSAEFSEWQALWRLRLQENLERLTPSLSKPAEPTTNEDLMAMALRWQAQMNARRH